MTTPTHDVVKKLLKRSYRRMPAGMSDFLAAWDRCEGLRELAEVTGLPLTQVSALFASAMRDGYFDPGSERPERRQIYNARQRIQARTSREVGYRKWGYEWAGWGPCKSCNDAFSRLYDRALDGAPPVDPYPVCEKCAQDRMTRLKWEAEGE